MAFGKRDAIKTAAELGNHVAVEFTGEVIRGYTVVHIDDMKVGGRFNLSGFSWEIMSISYPHDMATVTIGNPKEL